jgi:hypothetical protein
MAGEFSARPEILQGIAQSLLEMKKMARSIEQSADALRPLANAETDTELARIMQVSRESADLAGNLYRAIAKEAMS